MPEQGLSRSRADRSTGWRAVLIAIVFALVMAGCSSDDGNDADDEATGSTDPEERPSGQASIAGSDASDTDQPETSSDGGGIDDASSEGTDGDPGGGFCGGVPQAIRFDQGTEASTVSGVEVGAGDRDLYQLDVGDDQLMTVRVTSDDAVLAEVLAPGEGVASPVDGVITTVAGTYQICVSAGAEAARYDLFVSVIDDRSPDKVAADWCGDSVNDRGEIRFEPGEFVGVVEQGVIRGERDLYRLEASESQFIELNMTSLEDNAVFALRSAETGEVYIDEVSDFRFPLPVDGVYEICVGSTRGNASYVLEVAIS